MKTGRGQSAVVVALIVAFLALVGYLAVTTMGSKGYQEGADTIAATIDSIADPEIFVIEELASIDQAVGFWVNSQKLYPNKHSLEGHSDTAYKTTDCYNRNGTFQIWRIGNREFHLLCKDDDGSVRNIMLERESNTSNRFHMKNAFTRHNPAWDAVKAWLKSKGGQPVSAPKDIIIIIDGIIPG
jgi:hypothetical protein